MDDSNSRLLKKLILMTIIDAGYQITPDALEFLVDQPMGKQLIEEIISQANPSNIPTVITRDFLLSSTGKVELIVTTNIGRKITIQVNLDDKEIVLDRTLFDLNVNTHIWDQHEWDQKEKNSDGFTEYIPKIDLTPVSMCRNLRNFELSGLGVHEIDLSPLEECRDLVSFTFSGPLQHYIFRRWEDDVYSNALSGALIEEIDLSPLKNCENLRIVVLSNLNLNSLDLTPLNECTNLEELHIVNPCQGKMSGDASCRKWDAENNEVQIDFGQIRDCLKLRVLKLVKCPPINLNPLRRFANLEELEISDGVLDEIDLGIFIDCVHLKKINLTHNGNNLRSIDLGPLSKMPNFEELDMHECYLSRIDFGPLRYISSSDQKRPRIIYGNEQDEGRARVVTLLSHEAYGEEGKDDFFDIPINITSLHTIEGYYHSLKTTNEWKSVHLLQCIPNSIRMPRLGLLDANPYEFLPKIFKRVYDLDDYFRIQELYTRYLCDQIDRGGTTIGINLDKDTPAEIMMKSHRILELREKEMQSVSISISEEGIVDYLPLWMTAYGSRILTSLDKRLNDSVTELPKVEEAIQEIGYHLDTTGAQNDSPTKMSLSMMQYIRVMCDLSDISRIWDSSKSDWSTIKKEYVLKLPYFSR